MRSGLRLIHSRVQKDAEHADTFAPLHISLRPETYELMLRVCINRFYSLITPF